jgi:hypothetical protein
MAEAGDTNPAPLELTPTRGEEQADQELVMFLEPDQLDVRTSVPVPRALLGRRAKAGLWALRAFVSLVSVMVVYTFASQLK